MTEELRNEGLDGADHVHEWSDGCKVVSAGKSWRLECCECGANRIKAGSMDSESPPSDTPETDAASNAWLGNAMTPWNLARKLERERDRYKAAYDVAIYNLIGVAGYGHPGVSEATNIVDYAGRNESSLSAKIKAQW